MVLEDPAVAVERLSSAERVLQGREKAFGCKALFNVRLRKASNVSSVFWEKDPSIPGYRALVERPDAVRVRGYDPKGDQVSYIAKGWEARLLQQAPKSFSKRSLFYIILMLLRSYSDSCLLWRSSIRPNFTCNWCKRDFVNQAALKGACTCTTASEFS